jgi:hypothetical protein
MSAAQPAPAHPPAHSASTGDAITPRLDRLGRAVEREASARGLDVEYLGVEELFARPRLYGEATAPWVVTPAAADPMVQDGLPIPAAQQRRLEALVENGMDFPHLYLAHELARNAPDRTAKPSFATHRTLSDAELKRMLVRPEAPAAVHKTAKRVDAVARTVGRGIGLAAVGAGMVMAAPLLLIGSGLDPAVLGALTLPGTGHKPGTPAAWLLLARWDW